MSTMKFDTHLTPDLESVSKSKFKAKALEYFRRVERTGRSLLITDRGRPVLKLVPLEQNPEKMLQSLRGTVTRYDDPTEPVGLDDWETLR